MNGVRDLVAADRVLKAASAALVKNCGGGEGAAASLAVATGKHVRQQRMSDCGNMHQPDFLRLDEVGHLEDVALRDGGWPQVTRALASRHGMALVDLPQGDGDARDYFRILADLIGSHGAVSTAITQALADDHDVDAAEAAGILPDLERLIVAAVGLKFQLQEAR